MSRDVLLAVRGLGLRNATRSGGWKHVVSDVSFGLHKGEILGIAGLLGSGRTEILEAVFGSSRGKREGEIFVDGRAVAIRGPRDAIRLGFAFVTEDRKSTGLLLQAAIRENLSLPSEPLRGSFGLRDPSLDTRLARTAIRQLGVRCRGEEQIVLTLSGGNQQKVVLGKWLAIEPRVLLLDEPTRGIDVGAKKEIYDLVFRLAETGIAIVVVSSELPELLLLADRILVMREGRQAGIIDRADATEESVMRLASPSRGNARLQAAPAQSGSGTASL